MWICVQWVRSTKAATSWRDTILWYVGDSAGTYAPEKQQNEKGPFGRCISR